MNFKIDDFEFEVVEEEHVMGAYSAGCSNEGRSACCTRVCTRNNIDISEEQWGEFLEINAGVIQY
ncbi:MAG: hypothetical protein Q7K47_02325 [Fusobacterium sp. JB019]|nr:hypothetical protein [Fusobacterium sp. JB019]